MKRASGAGTSAVRPSASRSAAELLLADDLLLALGQHLALPPLLRLLSTCTVLHREAPALEVDLRRRSGGEAVEGGSMPAARARDFSRRFGQRFVVIAVDVHSCAQDDFDGLLAQLPALRELVVRGPGSSISSLAGVGKHSALRSLRLLQRSAASVTDLAPLQQCASLEALSLSCCASLVDTAPLGLCARLRSVELKKCERLRWERGGHLASANGPARWGLESLTLMASPISDCAALASLRRLLSLDLSLSRQLQSASPLHACPELRSLTLTGCTRLSDVDGLGDAPLLESLRLTGCVALTDVSGLQRCKALRTLQLSGCKALVDVSMLGHCGSLQLLNLRCSGVTSVPLRHGLLLKWDE